MIDRSLIVEYVDNLIDVTPRCKHGLVRAWEAQADGEDDLTSERDDDSRFEIVLSVEEGSAEVVEV